jgi:hypothetical protein
MKQENSITGSNFKTMFVLVARNAKKYKQTFEPHSLPFSKKNTAEMGTASYGDVRTLLMMYPLIL